MVVECGETSNPINRNEESLPGRRDPTTRKPGIWSRPVVWVEQSLMMVGFRAGSWIFGHGGVLLLSQPNPEPRWLPGCAGPVRQGAFAGDFPFWGSALRQPAPLPQRYPGPKSDRKLDSRLTSTPATWHGAARVDGVVGEV